jgi:hypothetical protein
MKAAAVFLCLVLMAACGGGDPEPEPSQMPCKYRPDCTPGPPISSAVPSGE